MRTDFRQVAWTVCLILLGSPLAHAGFPVFLRGDVNDDGLVSVADAYFLFRYLCCDGETPPCLDAADVDDDGDLALTDAVQIIAGGVFFGPPPAVPFPEPGADPTADDLDCQAYGPGSRVDVPEAELRFRYAEAIDGDADIVISLSTNVGLAGYSGRVRDEDGVLADSSTEPELYGGLPMSAEDLTMTTGSGLVVAARVRDGQLHFGFLADHRDPLLIEPGQRRRVLRLRIPLREGAPDGLHPLTLEAGELIDEAGASLQPTLFDTNLRVVSRKPFLRADCNTDGRIDISDAFCIMLWLFLAGPNPFCIDAADANDDGVHNITDIIYTLNWLFLGGPVPPSPGPYTCGDDPTPDIFICERYPPC